MIQERHDLNMVFRIQGPVMAFVLLIPFSCIDFTGLELNYVNDSQTYCNAFRVFRKMK